MDPIAELAEFDREIVAQAKAVEQRIQAESFAAGHTIRDVRVFRVLMPWVGTKRWNGSAESFTFAEFETDKGLVCIAEGANADAEELKGKVLGKNPFDPSIRADMGLAYWDLIGKIADRPLGQYLHELFALDLDALRRWQPADISAPDAYAGPLALKRYYDAARFLGMGIGMHSAYELGPATAIRLHIAAFIFPYEMPYHIVWGGDRTFPPFSAHAIDAHYNQWADDVICGVKMAYDQGFLAVPKEPGLGVELDPERLHHYAFSEEKVRPIPATSNRSARPISTRWAGEWSAAAGGAIGERGVPTKP